MLHFTCQSAHFTTAEFALADANKDGTVTKSERDVYAYDFNAVQNIAALIKGVIDFDKSELLDADVNDTLKLAQKAVTQPDSTLGSTGRTAEAWLSENAVVFAAVQRDVANSLNGSFASYNLAFDVTNSSIPATVTRTFQTQNGPGEASIYCELGDIEGAENVEIALDERRGIMVIKFAGDVNDAGGQIVGTFNAQNRNVSLREVEPLQEAVSNEFVTYFYEGDFSLTGVRDAQTGNISGTFNESTSNTWNLDSTRQTCTASGTFIARKL